MEKKKRISKGQQSRNANLLEGVLLFTNLCLVEAQSMGPQWNINLQFMVNHPNLQTITIR